MVIKLDVYDKKILYELDSNARQTYTTLAKKIHLSKDTIKYRINNYLKNNLISGFYTLINSSKLGFYSIRVYFNLKEIKEKDEKTIIHELKKEDNVFYLSEIDGEYKYGFGFFTKTLTEFQKFWKKIKLKFPQKFSEEKVDIFITLNHFNRNYFTNQKKEQFCHQIINEPNNENLDEKDIEILKILTDDARTSIIQIAQNINLTSKAVILRIKKLEKREIILGYKPKINIEKIGISMYKVDIKSTDNSKLELIKKQIYSLPNVIYSEETLGGPDLEFDIECHSYEEFNNIISNIKNQIGEYISSIKYYKTIKIYKTLYLPKNI